MIAEQEFQKLIREVVETCIPDEIDVLDFGADQMIGEVYRTGRPPVTNAASAENEFVEGAKAVLELIPLAIATWKTLKEAFFPAARKQVVTQEIIQQEWSLKLQAEGLPPALVTEVVARFSQAVAEIVTKYQTTARS